jgi:phage-related protein
MYNSPKPVRFMGSSLVVIRSFPDGARRAVGYQLDRIQHGLKPVDWKPMPTVGKGVCEMRVRREGQFRVLYVAGFQDVVVVLHAFQKKRQKTPSGEVALAKRAYRDLKNAASG